MAGHLAGVYHWTPAVVFDLTAAELEFWIDQAEKFNKRNGG